MRQGGKVKWFDKAKGFGFIIPDDQRLGELFVHYTGIDGDGFRSLAEDQRVAFEAKSCLRGYMAVRVRPEEP